MRPILLTLTLAGCGRLEFAEPPGPIAVGARFDVVMTNARLECGGLFGLDCEWFGGTLTSVEIDPPTAFLPIPGGGTGAFRAATPGEARVFAEGDLGDRSLSGKTVIEAAEVADVAVTVRGGFSFDRLVVSPGAEAVLGWAATDAEGRDLWGTDFLAWDDPDGVLDVWPEGSGIHVRAPPEEAEATLVGANGQEVASVRVGSAVPDRLEVLVADARGDVVPVRVVGWSGDEAILFGDTRIVLVSWTPEVCASPPEGEYELGNTYDLVLVGPGLCTVTAVAALGDGSELSAEGSGRVAPVIYRTAP